MATCVMKVENMVKRTMCSHCRYLKAGSLSKCSTCLFNFSSSPPSNWMPFYVACGKCENKFNGGLTQLCWECLNNIPKTTSKEFSIPYE